MSIAEFSTDAVPQSQRLDYWNGVLCEALFGFTMQSTMPKAFEGRLVTAGLDALTVCDSSGSERIAARTRYWLSRSPSHTYSLMVDFCTPWTFVFKGEHVSMSPGDVVLTDTRFEQEAHSPAGCYMRNIKMPVAWLETWVPKPSVLLGRRIEKDSRWGAALSLWIAQLTPAAVSAPPLPGAALTDHLGSLLSLIFIEQATASQSLKVEDRGKAEQIITLMRERRTEHDLSAAAIAASAGVDVRTLHSLLALLGTTFGTQLQNMRVAMARDLLSSAASAPLSDDEIAFRVGFRTAAELVRMTSRNLGKTPMQIRLESA